MYWFVRLGYLFKIGSELNVSEMLFRVRFWHPVLNATRPVRHALGLRQGKDSSRITK